MLTASWTVVDSAANSLLFGSVRLTSKDWFINRIVSSIGTTGRKGKRKDKF